MRRRALLAAPTTAALLAVAGRARGQPANLVTEEFAVPAREPGIELFLRNKRPETAAAAAPARTLLFVHGHTFPASTTFDLPLGGLSWMDYIAGRGFDVWSLDLRGFGRSARPSEMAQPAAAHPPLVRGDAALADLAAAVAFIRERRAVPRLVLMGWSWGTALAGRFAAENPALVDRLVLYAPLWLHAGSPALPAPTEAWRGLTQAQVRAAWVEGVPEPRRAALLPPGWFEHMAGVTWATDPDGQRQRPPALRVPNGPLAEMAEAQAAQRPFYDPARIAAPALLVLAEWDQVTPPAMAQALFPLLANSPGKRLVVLGEGTHAVMLERNRGALFQAVQVFLEEAAG
jgi:pimeloyl-ACP methyl ester carboxylesterase